MKNDKSKIYFYFSSLISFFLFLPIFNKGNIGSDWDSYALIGTYENFIKYKLYIPSRPPGFPLYEFLVGLCIYISDFTGMPKEKIILLLQFVLLIGFNYLIYCFFQKEKNSNLIVYLIIIFSPIYLISGLSAIDYFIGNLFGFLGIYAAFYLRNTKYQQALIILALSLSILARLSNVIYLFVVIFYIYLKNKNTKNFLLIVGSTLIISSISYFVLYSNLFNFYQSSNIYSSWSEMLCVFNLTNTDHDLINRLGRFTLKQIPFLGTVGSVLLISNLFKFNINIKNNYFYIFLIFLLFELSFFRLPTEEGHLLPAFISFMILISKNNHKVLLAILFFVSLSNFVDLKFYEVDKIDSASSISFTLRLEEGFLIQDYRLRNKIGEEKSFHYENSQITLYDAWSKGCPNK